MVPWDEFVNMITRTIKIEKITFLLKIRAPENISSRYKSQYKDKCLETEPKPRENWQKDVYVGLLFLNDWTKVVSTGKNRQNRAVLQNFSKNIDNIPFNMSSSILYALMNFLVNIAQSAISGRHTEKHALQHRYTLVSKAKQNPK